MKKISQSGIALLLLLLGFTIGAQEIFANTVTNPANTTKTKHKNGSSFFRQFETNYFLPYWYNQNLGENASGNLPAGQNLKHTEIKFQISFATHFIPKIFNLPLNFDFAYTQLSFWQFYQDSSFFQETNYQPQLFFNLNSSKLHWLNDHLDHVDAGIIHESNGRGGVNERAWNRIYLEAKATFGNFGIKLQPWLVLNDEPLNRYNPDITHYLGHGSLTLSYHNAPWEISLLTRNNLESGFKRGAVQVSLAYQLNDSVNLFAQWFNGYGLSLIDYNKKMNSYGVGISLATSPLPKN